MRRELGARRMRVRTFCRIALRSTSAQVRLGILSPEARIVRSLAASIRDVGGQSNAGSCRVFHLLVMVPLCGATAARDCIPQKSFPRLAPSPLPHYGTLCDS